jgi:hypothetical protein
MKIIEFVFTLNAVTFKDAIATTVKDILSFEVLF